MLSQNSREQPIVMEESWRQELEEAGPIRPCMMCQEQRVMDVGAQFTFSCLLSAGRLLMERWNSYARWVFLPQSAQSRQFLQDVHGDTSSR